ncbi:hypothetical protein K4W91_21390 [Pseudomonas aeruginosa]|uniref:hypothetical protein n=1 Tax=Pseudomonas aeruginosa TaxID=287 RepID=UPI000FD5C2CD|nr:hypothetical protein [Pseudomonas aeruginosa]MCD2824297.1 hypothetical protein [Pseudomonas aeruginosa]MCD2830655.1 hypothetical protein [Pseudomonas aeruginosa]RUI01260.1 hypothetical protein IPC449_25050 [Pseudomonas aeruginosa]HCF4146257.1 hypothetical protein [Pseudomonas aeruginosa]HCK3347108.1 hypothetical protein [Pseudomonas aeruginosa]
MTTIKTYLMLIALSAIAGCQTGLPSVQYRQACSPVNDAQCSVDLPSLVKFSLPKSLIVLAAKDESKSFWEQVPTGTVAPAEWEGVMIEMLKDDPWGRQTTLNVIRRESTNLIQAVNASVTDSRPEQIEKWGGISLKLLAVAIAACCDGPETPPTYYLPMPLVIDTAPLLAKLDATGGTIQGEVSSKDDIDAKATFRFTANPVPPDAIPVKEYLVWAKGKRTHEMITSVCRTVHIEFGKDEYQPLNNTKWSFIVADPNYVQAVSFPINGSMTAQSVCGFQVTHTMAEVDKTTEILGTSLTQIIAIADAWSTRESKKTDAQNQ